MFSNCLITKHSISYDVRGIPCPLRIVQFQLEPQAPKPAPVLSVARNLVVTSYIPVSIPALYIT